MWNVQRTIPTSTPVKTMVQQQNATMIRMTRSNLLPWVLMTLVAAVETTIRQWSSHTKFTRSSRTKIQIGQVPKNRDHRLKDPHRHPQIKRGTTDINPSWPDCSWMGAVTKNITQQIDEYNQVYDWRVQYALNQLDELSGYQKHQTRTIKWEEHTKHGINIPIPRQNHTQNIRNDKRNLHQKKTKKQTKYRPDKKWSSEHYSPEKTQIQHDSKGERLLFAFKNRSKTTTRTKRSNNPGRKGKKETDTESYPIVQQHNWALTGGELVT
jgi:hypothetical protein